VRQLRGSELLVRISRRRARRLAGVVLATLALSAMPLSLATAAATGSSLHASGPTSNKMGTNFDYVLSGSSGSGANRLVAWEQFNKVAGCAATFAGESARVLLEPTSTYDLTLWTNVPVSGSYSVTAHFGASHLGVHGICAYLINLGTGETLAAAGSFWTNHA